MVNVNIRPTFKLPYLESDSNRPTMTFKLTYYDIQTVLLGRSHLRQTRPGSVLGGFLMRLRVRHGSFLLEFPLVELGEVLRSEVRWCVVR